MNISRCDHRHHNHMFFMTFIFLNPYSLNQKCVSASWVNTGRPNPSTTLSLPTSSPSLSSQFSSSSHFDRWTRQGRPLSASRSHLLLAGAPDHVFVVDHHLCISFESSFGIVFFHNIIYLLCIIICVFLEHHHLALYFFTDTVFVVYRHLALHFSQYNVFVVYYHLALYL